MRKFTLNPIVLAMAVSVVPAATYAQELEEVVVTGSYAQSLRNALNVKRQSTGIVDSVFAEDIGKFPDQNLAESLGRIPGVAIERDDGEGRSITVRGLGDAYTAISVNGMQAQSLAAGSGGVRTSRAFDFNVFASELFNRLDVHKSTSAKLEDGSLGATVSLRTGRPFDYDSFTAAANAELGYNDGSGDTDPRLSGLVSVSNDEKTLGFLVSAAYSTKNSPVTGAESGRWEDDNFLCETCSPDELADIRSAKHPRIARYADKTNDQERLGLTSSLQWQIADTTLLTVDGLYSKIDVTRDEPFMQAISLARAGATGTNQMNVLPGYVIDSAGTLVSAAVENADFRSEAFQAEWDSEYQQISAELKHEFSDSFRTTFMAGTTESKMNNREVTVIYEHYSDGDSRQNVAYADSSDTISWDYSKQKAPVLSYSFDTTNPANWELSEYRDRLFEASASTDHARLDFEYDLSDTLTAEFGVTQKSYGYKINGQRADKVFSVADEDDGASDGMACGVSPVVTASDGAVITAGGQSFFYPDFGRSEDLFSSGCWEYAPWAGDTREVEEDVLGYFAQLSLDTEVFGNRLRGNVGVRQVTTDLTSSGVTVVSGEVSPVEVKHDYSDTLPAINIAYNLTDTLVLRAAAAEVLARPDLTDLNPGGSVAIFGDPKVSYGNPFIEPFRAKSYDLGLEWYYLEDALLGLTVFKKDVESFPTSDTVDLPWPEIGLPDSLLGAEVERLRGETFQVSRKINGGGAEINGLEVGWQQQLSFLPGPAWVQGFGFQANYTYVDAETDKGTKMKNVSEDSYNFTLYWEGERFQARITNSFRGEYYSNIASGNNVWKTRLVDDNSNWGVSASYDINDQLKVTFKGINITDEPKYEYEDADAKRVVIDAHTGASYFVGVSYSF